MVHVRGRQREPWNNAVVWTALATVSAAHSMPSLPPDQFRQSDQVLYIYIIKKDNTLQ